MIDPRIDHLTDHLMGRNLIILVHTLRALHPSDTYQKSYRARPISKTQELVVTYILLNITQMRCPSQLNILQV
jgi:hypothetical protein